MRHGLLVVTRSDLMDPELARDEALEHLADSSLGRPCAVCVSGATGAGLDDLRAALSGLVAALPTPDTGADVRLWADRAFTITGAGTVVTGTLAAGTLRVGDELALVPGGRRVTVRGLQSLGEPADVVPAVARVAVNLRGVPLEAVHRGDALLTPGAWLTSRIVDVRLHGSTDVPAEVVLHAGAAAVLARVRPLGADTVRLTLAHGLPLRIGDRALVRDPDAAAERAAQLAAVVAAQAAANPLEPGMPLETARQVVGLPDARLVELLLGSALSIREGRVHAGVPRPELPPAVARAVETVRAELTTRPFGAPDAGRLTELGLGVKQLAAAARAGQLLTVSDGIYLLPGADVAAAELLAELPTPFTLSEARQALDTTRRVAAVHYRLAPEHPFPAALEDALAAVAWVAEHATEIGADAERLAVGGDSSGASVTTAARRRRDLRLQVLVYPATDAAMDTPSHERYATGYYLERDEMRSSWDTYLGGADPTDPDASPLRADDLAGVAPALVLVAGFDPLHDEGVAYAERLQAAGVPVELVEFEGQIHGFLRWLAVPLGAGRLDHHPEGELEV